MDNKCAGDGPTPISSGTTITNDTEDNFSSGWSSPGRSLCRRLTEQRVIRTKKQLLELRSLLKKDPISADMTWSLFVAAVEAATKREIDVCSIEPWPHWFVNASGKREGAELNELIRRSPTFTDIARIVLGNLGDLKIADDVLGLLYWVLVINLKPHLSTLMGRQLVTSGQALYISLKNLEYCTHNKWKLKYAFKLVHSSRSPLVQSYNEISLESGCHRFRTFLGVNINQLHTIIHSGPCDSAPGYRNGALFTRNIQNTLERSPYGTIWKGSNLGPGFNCVLVCSIIDHPDGVRRHDLLKDSICIGSDVDEDISIEDLYQNHEDWRKLDLRDIPTGSGLTSTCSETPNNVSINNSLKKSGSWPFEETIILDDTFYSKNNIPKTSLLPPNPHKRASSFSRRLKQDFKKCPRVPESFKLQEECKNVEGVPQKMSLDLPRPSKKNKGLVKMSPTASVNGRFFAKTSNKSKRFRLDLDKTRDRDKSVNFTASSKIANGKKKKKTSKKSSNFLLDVIDEEMISPKIKDVTKNSFALERYLKDKPKTETIPRTLTSEELEKPISRHNFIKQSLQNTKKSKHGSETKVYYTVNDPNLVIIRYLLFFRKREEEEMETEAKSDDDVSKTRLIFKKFNYWFYLTVLLSILFAFFFSNLFL